MNLTVPMRYCITNDYTEAWRAFSATAEGLAFTCKGPSTPATMSKQHCRML